MKLCVPYTQFNNCHLQALVLTEIHKHCDIQINNIVNRRCIGGLAIISYKLQTVAHWLQLQHPKAFSQISYLYIYRTEHCFEQEVELSLHQQQRNERKHILFRTWNEDAAPFSCSLCSALLQCLKVSKHYCCAQIPYLKKTKTN